MSLSSDGSIVAIGAHFNDGNGTNSGHVRVYEWFCIDNKSWVQRGSDIDGEAADDRNGHSVSLSSDGSIVAIGATYNNDNGYHSGHVRVYDWNDNDKKWFQRGLDIDGEASQDWTGQSVALSSDGSIVALGTYRNDGVNGENSGHVRVYEWNDNDKKWVQRGSDIDGEAANDESGQSVALSSDGSIVAGHAPGPDGHGTNSASVTVYRYFNEHVDIVEIKNIWIVKIDIDPITNEEMFVRSKIYYKYIENNKIKYRTSDYTFNLQTYLWNYDGNDIDASDNNPNIDVDLYEELYPKYNIDSIKYIDNNVVYKPIIVPDISGIKQIYVNQLSTFFSKKEDLFSDVGTHSNNENFYVTGEETNILVTGENTNAILGVNDANGNIIKTVHSIQKSILSEYNLLKIYVNDNVTNKLFMHDGVNIYGMGNDNEGSMSIKYLLNIFNNENDISLNTILRYGVNELTSNNMDKKYLNQGYDILEITHFKMSNNAFNFNTEPSIIYESDNEWIVGAKNNEKSKYQFVKIKFSLNDNFNYIVSVLDSRVADISNNITINNLIENNPNKSIDYSTKNIKDIIYDLSFNQFMNVDFTNENEYTFKSLNTLTENETHSSFSTAKIVIKFKKNKYSSKILKINTDLISEQYYDILNIKVNGNSVLGTNNLSGTISNDIYILINNEDIIDINYSKDEIYSENNEKVIIKMQLVNEFYNHWNNSISETGNNISNFRGYLYTYLEIDEINTTLRTINTIFADDYIDLTSYKFGDQDIVIYKFISKTELLFVGYNSFSKNFIRSLILKIGNINNLLTLQIIDQRFISYSNVGEPNYYNLESIWNKSNNTIGYSLTNVVFKIKKYTQQNNQLVNIPSYLTDIKYDNNINNIINNNNVTYFYNRNSLNGLKQQNNVIYSSGLNNIIDNRYTGIKVKNEIATIVSDDIFVINKNYTVKKIDVKKIDVGSNHAYIIDNNNDIYSFGDNTYKQLVYMIQ